MIYTRNLIIKEGRSTKKAIQDLCHKLHDGGAIEYQELDSDLATCA